MGEINWLHISDLHFGSETKIKDIETIRRKFLDYVKTKFKGKIEFNYLFVTGDIFNGREFFDDSSDESKREQFIKKATEFFDELISNMAINKNNVFIVPGNHDTNRKKRKGEEKGEKEIYIEELRHKYESGIRVFDEKAMQAYKIKYQSEFNKFCAGLGVKYCDKAHKLDKRNDADILMLNTSISSCKSEEKSNLLLGKFLFEEEFEKIDSENKEDESRPLFILAHHCLDYFIDNDIMVMKSKFECKKNSALYLCGHNHFADVKKIDDIHILLCGTDVGTEEVRKGNYKKNEVNFLRGSFDSALEETTVYFYKWSRERWMENRDLRQDKRPHHIKTIEGNSRKTKILKSKSESEAVNEFYGFLRELYEKSNQKQDKCTYFGQKAISLIETIEERKPEWRFENKFGYIFNTNTNELEILKNSIMSKYLDYREVDGLIRQKNYILTEKISEKEKENKDKSEWKFGILLYSKSIRVTNYLLSLPPCIKEKCIIYNCAGNVRGNTIYKDGLDIADELFDPIPPDFNGFSTVKLIPDIYVDKIIKEDKIHAVLLGAVALYYGSENCTCFSNTVGSGLIIDLATKKGIACFVIAEQSKAFNSYPNPKAFNLYTNSKDKEKIKETDYPNKDLIKHIKPEFEEFELVEFKGIKLISDREMNTNSWYNSKEPLSKEAFILFLKEILKDRRKLSLSDDKKTITKTFLPEDILPDGKAIERNVISKLIKAKIIPDIVDEKNDKKDDCIALKYYKGIRIFNFLVALDSLKKEYKFDNSKINQLDLIARKLLFLCEEKQKRIQKELYEQYKNSKQISPYPKEKLTEIIKLFFICFEPELKAKVDKQTVLNEMDWIYDKFSANAKVPFRDATTKNMILVYEDLYFEKFKGNVTKRNAEIKKLFDSNKLQDIISSEDKDIIDIDFSSCVNYTTPYDDVISFRFHEITAPYYQSYDNLIWNNIAVEEGTEKESIVATFIVRFLRFGGRKLLYRVIDPIHHAMRFKHDNESYYFEKLPEIIEHYGFTEEKKELSETKKLFKEIKNIVGKISKERQKFFIIPYDDPDVMKIIKEIAENGTYSDVYPY